MAKNYTHRARPAKSKKIFFPGQPDEFHRQGRSVANCQRDASLAIPLSLTRNIPETSITSAKAKG